jgi:hypothetical protein
VALDWKAAAESNDADVIAAFLQAHGDNTMYRLLATQKLALLKAQKLALVKIPETKTEAKPVEERPKTEIASETDCDRLAANPDDPLKLASVRGVVVPKIEVERAGAACNASIQRFPNEGRFKYQFARVLNAQGKQKEAFQLYLEASKLGYSTADANIGLSYAYGVGVEADAKAALTWLRKSMKARNSIAFCNMAAVYNEGLGVMRDPSKSMDLANQCIALGSKFGLEVKAAIFSSSRDFDGAADAMFLALKAGRQSAVLSLTENDSSWPLDFRKAFQRRLTNEGLYTGPLDGSFGAGTRSAISAIYEQSQ